MIRVGIIFTLIIALAGVAWLEQHTIQGAYNKLERDVTTLGAIIMQADELNERIDTEENIAMITRIYEWWLRQERRLSMLARHFDFAQVSTQLIYTKNFIIFNNHEEAHVGILQTRYLIKTHSFNVGTSIQNVI